MTPGRILFLLAALFAGELIDGEQVVYIPKKPAPVIEGEEHKNDRYCYHFTWLGGGQDNNTYPAFMNKTCADVFVKENAKLCVDPMAITFRGGMPNIDYIWRNYFKVATCKLSDDRVCAKYTIYYNGVPSHVVRYCTRIDVESEGPLRSGCLTAKNGSYEYEVCACRSSRGVDGICNDSNRPGVTALMLLTTAIFLLVNG